MGAIDTLMQEHREIERGLTALESFASQVLREPAADEREHLARLVTFIREFADARHHGKEEDILFRAMINAGFPTEAGPLAVMLAEHAEGRALIGKLNEWAQAGGVWDEAARAQIAQLAHAFVGLLRAHIMKEDNVLYPMAQARLPGEAFVAIDEAVARFEADPASAADRDRLLALLETI